MYTHRRAKVFLHVYHDQSRREFLGGGHDGVLFAGHTVSVKIRWSVNSLPR